MVPHGYNEGFIARMHKEPHNPNASDAWQGGWFDCDMEYQYHSRELMTDSRQQHYNAVTHYHIATRPLPPPTTKTKESWQCLLCKSDLAGKHGVLDDGNTPCPNTKKEQP